MPIPSLAFASFAPQLRLPLSLAAAGLLLSCGGGGGGSTSPGGGSTPPPANTFYVGGQSGGGGYGDPGSPMLTFQPANLTVAKGTTVTWVWQGGSHALDSGTNCTPSGLFGSNGVKGQGYSMTYTFNTAGTFPFYCSVHCGSNMTGTVTVTP